MLPQLAIWELWHFFDDPVCPDPIRKLSSKAAWPPRRGPVRASLVQGRLPLNIRYKQVKPTCKSYDNITIKLIIFQGDWGGHGPRQRTVRAPPRLIKGVLRESGGADPLAGPLGLRVGRSGRAGSPP